MHHKSCYDTNVGGVLVCFQHDSQGVYASIEAVERRCHGVSCLALSNADGTDGASKIERSIAIENSLAVQNFNMRWGCKFRGPPRVGVQKICTVYIYRWLLSS